MRLRPEKRSEGDVVGGSVVLERTLVEWPEDFRGVKWEVDMD